MNILKTVLTITLIGGLAACASGPERGGDRGDRGDRGGDRGGQRTGGMMLAPAGLLIAGFDTDQDYQVTREEQIAGTRAAFTRADVNSDGSLSLFEFEDWRERALGSKDAPSQRLGFDTDMSRSISRREFEDAIDRMLQNADKDGDSIVAYSELVSLMRRQSQRPQSSGGQGRGGGGQGQGGGRPPRQ